MSLQISSSESRGSFLATRRKFGVRRFAVDELRVSLWARRRQDEICRSALCPKKTIARWHRIARRDCAYSKYRTTSRYTFFRWLNRRIQFSPRAFAFGAAEASTSGAKYSGSLWYRSCVGWSERAALTFQAREQEDKIRPATHIWATISASRIPSLSASSPALSSRVSASPGCALTHSTRAAGNCSCSAVEASDEKSDLRGAGGMAGERPVLTVFLALVFGL